MDPSIQQMRKKTRNPAKMVGNGGPWAVSPDFSVMESPLGGLEQNNLSLLSNFTVPLNLQVKQ